jgi:hypothetical protein
VSNPLVAAPVDTATPFSGAGLLDSGTQLASAIQSGDWLQGTLAGVGVALDTAATVIDPLGSLIAAGLGWLIDHLEPLKGWFNDFTGDAGEVAAFGQTWANIQTQLRGAAENLAHFLGDVDELAGEAMDAYRRFQAETAEHLAGAASWAGAMSTGLQIASTVVQVVHDLVRDVLSQLVGSIISWAAEAIFTLGLATPVIVGQVTTRVASLSARVGRTVIDAVSSCKSLSSLLEQLTALLRKAGSLFDSVLKGGTPSSPRNPLGPDSPSTPHAPTTPRDPDAPPVAPAMPAVPRDPDVPTPPRSPDVPSAPREPDVPTPPRTPDLPATPPRDPDLPSTPPRDPDLPATPPRDPDTPTTPPRTPDEDAPSTPRDPDEDAPSTPRDPDEDAPATPTTPDVPPTLIDDVVEEIPRQDLPASLAETFTDGAYRTVRTTEPIELYRVYGGDAAQTGGFASTEYALDRATAMERSALNPAWNNTREFQAIIEVPPGTVLQIGQVAPQTIDGGRILAGGADQILLPRDWDSSWIRQVDAVPERGAP